MTQECTASMVRCVSLEFENSRIESRVHEEADGSRVPRKLLKYFVEMVDGKRDKRFVHMTGKIRNSV